MIIEDGIQCKPVFVSDIVVENNQTKDLPTLEEIAFVFNSFLKYAKTKEGGF